MCSRPFRPLGFPIYVVRCPAAPFARSYPRHFTLITRTAPVLAPATLAALPSTRASPDRAVFYLAHPIRSIFEFARAREPNVSDCTNCRCVIDAVYRRLLQVVGRNSRKRLNRSRTYND